MGKFEDRNAVGSQESDATQYDDRFGAGQRDADYMRSVVWSDDKDQETVLAQSREYVRWEAGDPHRTVMDHAEAVCGVSIELPPRHADRPQEAAWRGVFTAEAERLLPELLSSEEGPITMDELLEAVLLIRKKRHTRPENETVCVPQEDHGSRYSQYGYHMAISNRAYLRLADGANGLLPQIITVELGKGDVFTIGRFDVSLGRKQSSFEFDKKTKAVSRRHAMIERQMDGTYLISDCGSKAGTFVDGEKILPNVPYRIHCGTRISFGTAGADYIWDE